MPTPAQLALTATSLETKAGASTSANAGSPGYWKRIAAAAETLAGAITTANAGIEGYMLRAAIALEILSATTGAEENTTYEGKLKRIVDALEVKAGAATVGSWGGRLRIAAENAVFVTDPSAGFALYLPFSAASPTYRSGATTYSPVTTLPGYAMTRTGSKGEQGASGATITYAADLVVNGDGSNGTTGWTPSASNITNVAGRLRVSGTGVNEYAYQIITTVVGKTYHVDADVFTGTSDVGRLRLGTFAMDTSYPTISSAASAGTFVSFVATTTTTYITLFPQVGGVGYAEFDNVRLREVTNSPIWYFNANQAAIIPGVGYWLRGALTNLEVQSQTFGARTLTTCTVAADNVVAPDGTTTADTLTATAVMANAAVNLTIVASTLYTTSAFIPAGGTGLFAYIQINAGVAGASGSAFLTFNRSTGAISAVQTITAGIVGLTGYAVAVGGGWRFIATWTGPAAITNADTLVGLSETTATRVTVIGKTMPAWQGQTIIGNHPAGGPIIPTVATTMATGADVLSHTMTAPTDVDQLFFAKVNVPAFSGTQGAVHFDDGTNNNRIILYLNAGAPTALVVVAAVNQYNNATAAIAADVDAILVLRRLSGNWRFGSIVSGVLTWAASAAGTMPPGMVNDRPGLADVTGINQLNGKLVNQGIKVGTFTTDAEVIAAATI